jgi:hypothetical protein
MTFGDLYAYTKEQVDWTDSPQLTATDRRLIWPIVKFLYARENNRAACSEILVSDATARGCNPGLFRKLERYASTFSPQPVPTVPFEDVAPDLATALSWSGALAELDRVMVGPIQHAAFNQEQFNAALADNAIGDFASYVSNCDPLIQAHEGKEVESFLEGRREGANFNSYTNRIGPVRNFHRFNKDALDGFATNWADTSKQKPLTLILHTAVDHNGAFHRDPFMTEVAQNTRTNAVLVEGARTLAEAEGHVQSIAATHGQQNMIDQVMIAGHGNARSMELAADSQVQGNQLTYTDESLEAGDASTTAFFQALTSHMDPNSSNHRIVLNACLTNSIDLNGFQVTEQVSDGKGGMRQTTPAERRTEAAAYVAANPSLVDQLSAMAPGLDIRGANASIGQVDLIDPQGRLHIQSPNDPSVMASKETYIKKGTECTGAVRAVLAVTLQNPAQAHAAMRYRLQNPTNSWFESIIAAIYRIILRDFPNDVGMIQQMDSCGHAMCDSWSESECRVSAYRWIPQQYQVELLKVYLGLNWANEPWVPVVVNQLMVRHGQANAVKDLLESCGDATFNVASIRDFVDLDYLAPYLGLIFSGSASGAKLRGRQSLALLSVIDGHAAPEPKNYIRGLCRRNGGRLPAACISLIEGASTENDVLVEIGLRPGGANADASQDTTVDANADPSGSGTNSIYIENTEFVGITVFYEGQQLLCEPRVGSAVHCAAVRDRDYAIFGKVGEYYAVEDNHQLVYLHSSAGFEF